MNGDLQPGPGAIGAALQWLQATLLGSVATGIAVIAVASIGFLLFSGRIDVRRSVRLIAGCFILFGASSIAAGIVQAIGGSGAGAEAETAPPPPVSAPPLAPPASRPAASYDPYAGAALPTRR